MRLNLKISLTTFLVITITLLIINSCKEKKDNSRKKLTSSYSKVNKLEVDLPVYPSGWISHNADTPAPEEGKGSPFDVSSTTNGIFHQWSWQKFLWLTKPSSDSNSLPLFLNQEYIVQVNSLLDTVKQKTNANVVLDAIDQAGSSGHLKTNALYSDSSSANTVYYSIHASPTFLKNAQIFKDSIISKVTKPSGNSLAFPVASLELKVSWVETSAIASSKLDDYFTTSAALSSDGGKTFIVTEVALLGMHVVGVVENHPEFIWATFEHTDLGPSYDWTTNKANSTSEQLLFSAGSTTGLDGISWNDTLQTVRTPSKAYNLFKYNVPKNASGYMTTSQEEPKNFNNMSSINYNALTNLKDVWKNYFYNGSIWIDTDGMSTQKQAFVLDSLKYDIAHATPKSFARGSLNNANISMETFTQTFNKYKTPMSDVKVSNLANCFSCHSAVSFKKDPITGNRDVAPMYISHVFDAYIQAAQGNSEKEIEIMKAKHEAKIMNRKN